MIFSYHISWRLLRPYTSSHLIPDILYGWQIRGPVRPIEDPYFLQGVSSMNRSVESCITVSCWNMPFGTLVRKAVAAEFTVIATYWQAFSLSSANTKSILLSYPIASHTMISGVEEVCASIIAASCDLSSGPLQTRWRWSNRHKQKRDPSLNTTECHSMSQLTVTLHHASLCCVWYGVSGKQRMATRDLNPASSNLFTAVYSDSLSVTSAWILPVVIHLFVRASRRILQSSHGVLLLEGCMPALRFTLLSSWVRCHYHSFCSHCTTANCQSDLLAWCSHVPHANDSNFHKVQKMAISFPCMSSGHALLRSIPEKVQ